MKNVTLRKDSWHYKYYNATIGGTPPTLCPYFWRMIILIIISPIVGLVFGSMWVIKNLPKNQKPAKTHEERFKEFELKMQKQERNEKRIDKASDYFVIFVKWVLIPATILFIIYSFYTVGLKIGFLVLLIKFGIAIATIAVLGLAIWASVEYEDKLGTFFSKIFRTINPLNWKLVQIVGHMINAWYIKACPLITWEDKEVNENEQNYRESLNKG